MIDTDRSYLAPVPHPSAADVRSVQLVAQRFAFACGYIPPRSLKRSAAWTEADARGITEAHVFDQWSPR